MDQEQLIKEFIGVIEKSLPAMQVDVIRKELIEGNTAKLRVKELEVKLRQASDEKLEFVRVIEALNQETFAAKKILLREETVTKKESDVAFKERVLEIREEHSRQRVVDHVNMVELVFSNNRLKYKETMSGAVPVAVPGSPPTQYNSMGSPGYVTGGSVNLERVVEQS